ncbi:MAG: hypothetical protein KJO53_02875 [Eudoraea sp.]|nr:hypothetical protein [Eudoraea sp.]
MMRCACQPLAGPGLYPIYASSLFYLNVGNFREVEKQHWTCLPGPRLGWAGRL